MVYGFSITDLLTHLGFQHLHTSRLDWRPPDLLVEVVSARTGVKPETISRTTVRGMLPFLFTYSDPDCVGHKAVLLPPSNRRPRYLSEWLPWFRRQRRQDEFIACRLCLADYPNTGILLPWRLTIMLSCPAHGLMLEPTRISSDSVEWLNADAEEAPALIRWLDTLNWTALTEGLVRLPGNRIRAGLWFRLLQTICDELNRRIYGWGQRQLIRSVWDAVDCSERTGTSSADRRRAVALAMAIKMIEKGSISPQGADANIFKAMVVDRARHYRIMSHI